MTRNKTSARVRATAYHEAGHAVAHFLLHRRIDRVTIVGDDESAGRVTGQVLPHDLKFLDEPGSLTLRQRKAVEDDIVARLAGAEAECRHTGESQSTGAGTDVRGVFYLAERVCRSPQRTRAYVDYLDIVAQEMIESDWGLVEALADELVKRQTLSGPATRRVLRDARGRQLEEAIKRHPVFGAHTEEPE